MKKTTSVRHTLKTLPPLTDERRAELAVLAALPDSQIDTNDAAEVTAEQWDQAMRGRFTVR